MNLNVESLSDNYTPADLVERTVSWGDGTTEPWTAGATITHVYTRGRHLHPERRHPRRGRQQLQDRRRPDRRGGRRRRTDGDHRQAASRRQGPVVEGRSRAPPRTPAPAPPRSPSSLSRSAAPAGTPTRPPPRSGPRPAPRARPGRRPSRSPVRSTRAAGRPAWPASARASSSSGRAPRTTSATPRRPSRRSPGSPADEPQARNDSARGVGEARLVRSTGDGRVAPRFRTPQRAGTSMDITQFFRPFGRT